MGDGRRWNANLHAFDTLLPRVPRHAVRGLDVGCGEGETARRLRTRVPNVVGIDPHEPSLHEARSYGDDIEYLVGDLRTAELPPRSFDVVTAVAMLHHVDHGQGLRRLADLVAPGGRLLVVGLSFARKAGDYARDAWDALAIRRHTLTKRQWHTTAPIIWPPPLSYDQVRTLSADVLPACEVRRVPYFRYSLVWTAPPA